MRFMCMHRTDANNEADVPPNPEVFANMGPLIERMMQSGIFLAGEGLRASAHGVRLNYAGGKLMQNTPGTFRETKGLISGFAIVQVASLDAAADVAARFAEIFGEVEIDIRPVMEMWDLGMCPKPEGLALTRYGLTYKPAQADGGVTALPVETRTAIATLSDELSKSGVLLMGEGLRPLADSVRLKCDGGKPIFTDGPFAESKELIAGFSILELPSTKEAIEWSTPFAHVVGDVEIDIRPLYEPGKIAS